MSSYVIVWHINVSNSRSWPGGRTDWEGGPHVAGRGSANLRQNCVRSLLGPSRTTRMSNSGKHGNRGQMQQMRVPTQTHALKVSESIWRKSSQAKQRALDALTERLTQLETQVTSPRRCGGRCLLNMKRCVCFEPCPKDLSKRSEKTLQNSSILRLR